MAGLVKGDFKLFDRVTTVWFRRSVFRKILLSAAMKSAEDPSAPGVAAVNNQPTRH